MVSSSRKKKEKKMKNMEQKIQLYRPRKRFLKFSKNFQNAQKIGS